MRLLTFKSSQKPTSHTSQILQQLKKSGSYGSYNHELAKVGGLAWHRRITDLRKSGVNIQRVRLTRGTHKYYLNPEEK